MKATQHSLLVVTFAAFLAGAGALVRGAPPVVNGAVGVVGGAAGGLSLGGGNSASAISSSAFHGNGATGQAIGVGSASGSGATFEAAGIPGGDFESIGMRQERVRAQTQAGTSTSASSTMPAANVAAVDHNAPAATSARVETEAGVAKVRDTTFDGRTQMVAQVNEQMDANEKAMAELKEQSKSSSAEAQADFKAAAKAAAASQKQLKRDLKVANKASADTWADAHSAVVADYDAYASAMTRAEAAVSAPHASSATPAQPNSPGEAATPATPATPSVNASSMTGSDTTATVTK